jgi:nicotinate-nucleotide adenylyltransferase
MKIGLFFGSFNPIHVGHLIIANHILNDQLVDKLWFVVSPQNPLKSKGSLLNAYDRLYLVKIATEEDPRIKVSDLEFHLPPPSYTINTLTYLAEKYPADEFFVIMGADSFQNLHNWKNYEALIRDYEIIVYKRLGFSPQNKLNAKVNIIDAPILDITATQIRQLVKEKKSIRYMVPEKVREEIERCGYFKKQSQ